jgi:hypothetical protein
MLEVLLSFLLLFFTTLCFYLYLINKKLKNTINVLKKDVQYWIKNYDFEKNKKYEYKQLYELTKERELLGLSRIKYFQQKIKK